MNLYNSLMSVVYILCCFFCCTEILIPRMGHLNTPDRNGKTCMHHAAYNGHTEVSCMCVRVYACMCGYVHRLSMKYVS